MDVFENYASLCHIIFVILKTLPSKHQNQVIQSAEFLAVMLCVEMYLIDYRNKQKAGESCCVRKGFIIYTLHQIL
jgi:hypothetical protein